MDNSQYSPIRSALFGLAVGDALGVPVEFKSREYLKENPVTDMIGYGTYNQPPGTWSDDSSLTFCLAESLCNGYNIQDQANMFVRWRYENHWTPYGRVFDIGIATRQAIEKMKAGTPPIDCGGTDEHSNGNGSLMRILPLVFYIRNLPIEERWQKTKEVSSLTHAHIRSVMACFYYLEFARLLLEDESKVHVYRSLQSSIPEFWKILNLSSDEIDRFSRLQTGDISQLPEIGIQSTGYVLHTLEAAIWCLLTTENYKDCVLKAVNLGDDTDTTGAVVGGLAGLVYGVEGIPESWLKKLAAREEIEALCDWFAKSLAKNGSVEIWF